MKKVAEIVAEAGSADMTYIYDAPFHYIVIKKKDFKLTTESLNKYMALLDQVEAACKED